MRNDIMTIRDLIYIITQGKLPMAFGLVIVLDGSDTPVPVLGIRVNHEAGRLEFATARALADKEAQASRPDATDGPSYTG